jgi:glycosyltransferase involved in cell wall biosynthesis
MFRKLTILGLSLLRQYGLIGVVRHLIRSISSGLFGKKFRTLFESFTPPTKSSHQKFNLFSSFEKSKFGFLKKVIRERGVRQVALKAIFLLRAGTFTTYLRDTLTLQKNKISDETQIIIVANDLSWVSHIYRGNVFEKALVNLGFHVTTISETECQSLTNIPESVKCIYFFRTGTSPADLTWWKNVYENVVIGYDTDDLIFDDSIYHMENVAGLKHVDKETYHHLTVNYLMKQQAMIREADFLSSPTSAISNSYTKFSKAKVVVIPNIYLDSIEPYFRKECYDPKDFVIGYASGTKTHDKDFEVCIDAVWKFMESNPFGRLEIVGYAPIDIQFVPNSLRNRVTFIKPVPHNQLLDLIRVWSVNIAPLEINDFTHGKSELKFLHAALMQVPTIASPSLSFLQAITNGHNGIIAYNSEDWFLALEKLYSNPNFRRQLGDTAYKTAQKHYTLNRVQEILQDSFLRVLE